MKVIIFTIFTIVLIFTGCGIESNSSAGLSSSKTVGEGDSDEGSGTVDNNDTDPGTVEPSTTELVLASSSPSNSSMDVAVDASVTLTFNNSLDSTTVNETSFSFAKDGSTVLFSVVDNSNGVVTLKTDEVMEFSSTYVIVVNSELKDIHGNSVSSSTTISFTTVSSEVPSNYDANACNISGHVTIYDNSDTSEGVSNDDYGMGLTSYYPKDSNGTTSFVRLYFPSKFDQELDAGRDVVVSTTNYSFSFNKSWVQNSNKTVYISTPERFGVEKECYRYELNSTKSSDISSQITLVFR